MVKIAALACGFILAAAGAAYAGPFQNGSFEINSYSGSGGYQTLGTGDTSMTGWTVTSGNVDLINTYWQAAQGNFSLDMSGDEAGAIAQTFDTVAGHGYDVTFDLAGNPDGGNVIKQLLVSAAGASDVYSFDTAGFSHGDMGWTLETFFFIADSSSTTLTFASLEGNPYGPALDNVSVQDVPEPGSVAVLGLGLLGLGVMARRRA
jgi:choice-of-anchor C domain-containing protein